MTRPLVLLLAAVQVTSCAAAEPEAQTPIQRESPADAILRIGKSWEATVEDRSFRSPPSRIAFMTTRFSSRLDFVVPGAKGGGSTETVSFSDKVETQERAAFVCTSEAAVPIQVAFSEVSGDPIVEVRRPALQLTRRCDSPGMPEPVFDVPATLSRFALRGDQLVPVAPPTEKRVYIPSVQ